jgi:hypothetical protein
MSPKIAKADNNQPKMVADIRKAGLHVMHTHTIGKGAPDLVVTGYHQGINMVAALLVEIKDDKGKLTADEMIFHAEYPADGPLIIARCADDVLRWFEIT